MTAWGGVIRTMGPLPHPTHDPPISGRPVTETRHDAFGRVAWTRDPEGRFVVLEHDDAGQETRRCLAQGEDDDGELDPVEDLVECVTTEHDDIGHHRFLTRAAVLPAAFDFMEDFYNHQRCHSSLR